MKADDRKLEHYRVYFQAELILYRCFDQLNPEGPASYVCPRGKYHHGDPYGVFPYFHGVVRTLCVMVVYLHNSTF